MRRTYLGMRRPFVLAVALLVSMGLALPAVADKPGILEGGVTFEDLNPCSPTGETHFVTINFVARVHEHQNNFVLISKRNGTTTSGFVMVNGTEHVVIPLARDVGTAGLTDTWWNPETGERFIASFAVEFDPTTEQVIRFIRQSLRCLGS